MKTKALRFISLALICAFIITTCRKDEKVTDLEITDVTVVDNTVKVSGKIISLSGNKNSDYGVAYSIRNTSPVVTDTVVKLGPPAVGTFSAEIKDLKRNKTYNIRGFIKEGDTYLYDNVRTAQIVAIPPVSTSKAAASVAETTVTLNGSVNPNGTSTAVSFEYGTSTAYGSTIDAVTNIINGSSLTDVTANLTGLTPNTTYHFRVKATNAAGTVTGEDLTFTTLASLVAPTATSSAATSVTNTTATINGSVNANLSSTTVTFEYGTTSFYGSTANATPATVTGITPSNVSAALTGLIPGQLYHFRVKAVSAGGTTYGEDLTFTTTQPPVATTQNASNITLTTATLNGEVNSNGSATAITFEYGTTTSYGTTVNGVPDNATGNSIIATKVDISGLTENTTYHFRVIAVSVAGTITGSDMSFKTTTSTPPSAVTTDATSLLASTATLNGSVNANGFITAITFEYGTTTSYGSSVAASPSSSNGITLVPASAAITGLSANTLYHFRLRAESQGGIVYGDDFTFMTLSPVAVTAAATTILANSATLNGSVNANGIITTISFEYGLTTSYGSSIAASPATSSEINAVPVSATLAGLTYNTLYHFRLKAVSQGSTVYGDDFTFATPTPPAVTTLAAKLIYPTTATLQGLVNANGSTTSIKFEYGTTTSYGIVLFGIPDNASGYSDTPSIVNVTGLTKSTLYHFRIVAESNAGKVYGNDMTFTTLENDPTTATLTTKSLIDITSSAATGGGNISSDGGSEVTARGVCYSTNATPTIDDSRTVNGTGPGDFSSPFTGLTPSTLYYVRAYATNHMGTAYGNEVQFTSSAPPAELPTISTVSISDITHSSATSGGNITDDGGGTITVSGICWSTTENPTTSDSKTTNGTGSGIYTSSLTALSPNTVYYVRSYATNSAGTAYGDQVMFTTPDPPVGMASLTTTSGSDITTTGFTSGGNITSDGGGGITERGICYGLASEPTIDGPKTSDGTGAGVFVSNVTSLLSSTKYYIRAYATNSAGTAYGSEVTVTTSTPDPVLPTLSTTAVSVFNHISATAGGDITSDGGASVTSRGVCWSTSTNPTTSNSSITIGSGTGTFSGSVTGLNFSTEYYVRSWAVNSVGIVYGNEVSFTTLALPYVIPTLSTTAQSAVTSSTATTGGNISNDGGDPVTSRGVCYGNSSNPTIFDNVTSDGTGTGIFTSNLTGLSGSTLYYVRAYATNNAGTGYGSQILFTTPVEAGAPVLTTTAASAIGTTTATSGGNITDDGDAGGPKIITSRGVCWSTSANPTTSNSKTTDGTGTGSFTSSLSGLIPCTTYHIRAYATNDAGFTAYGSDLTFTTASVLPTVATTALTSPASTSVSTGGTISGNCASTVTERGVCWGTSSGPTTSGSKLTNGIGSGSFPISITGLIPCTTYYIRSYAINGSGTQYGNELSFTTSTVVSAISTTAINSATVTTTGATVGGTISGNCTTGVTRGIVYKTTSTPALTIANSTVVNSGTGPGAYSVNLTGLIPCTTYYVRAYTTNSAGTVYGDPVSFTTKGVVPGAVTTAAITSLTATTAVSGGTISGNCSSGVTYGVCWSTSTAPHVGLATKTALSGSPTSFVSSISGLTRATTYYVRAYATNSTGTTYGTEVPFTTPAVLPTVTTSTISTIISGTATSGGGNVTDEGGSAVTARGICWGTSVNPTTGNSITTNGTGAGLFDSSISGLTPGTTYNVRAYATNSIGTSYGINRSFTTPANLTDYDGNVYGTVSVNGNVWMQSNLKVIHYAGGSIGGGSDTSQFGGGGGAFLVWLQYNDNASYGDSYGLMYNWSVASSSANICPTGWHVPSQSEWYTLASNLGGTSVAGSKMNDVARYLRRIGMVYTFVYSYWNNGMTGHDNSSMFYGRGGGYYDGGYAGILETTRWWTSTSQRYVRIDYNYNGIYGTTGTSYASALGGFYIRCKKD